NKPDYTHHYNDFSVKKSLDFLKTNYKILDKCQKKYGVPKEVITSVIWIETKHGNYLGKHHIPSVFLSTAMANQEVNILLNKKNLHESYNGSKNKLPALEKKIEKRASKKSKWAINEIKNLGKIYKAGKVNILNLNGSWAGAFGLSQFLPSSYIRWAVDGNGDGIIDLFNTEDAIYSVANYLKVNGWGDSKEQQEKAVYHYNNSKAYVNAVLTLAEKVKKRFSESEKAKQQNPE
ncbi:lytic murein transglycosylase, partial [Bacteroidota bacterium]